MRGSIAIEEVAEVVRAHGHSAEVTDGALTVCPENGVPYAYRVPSGQVERRLVIQIGKRCGIPSECFWHPDMTWEDALRNSGVANIEDAKKKRDSKKPTGSDGSE